MLWKDSAASTIDRLLLVHRFAGFANRGAAESSNFANKIGSEWKMLDKKLLVSALVAVVVSGCGAKQEETTNTTTSTDSSATQTTTSTDGTETTTSTTTDATTQDKENTSKTETKRVRKKKRH
ncbi:MAG: hypothetical protein JST89_08185 [Cyanobacteria bacterium SZAS-4]|nr:hypothetical protein [Cyanobacteria bacterium SZAS-4]